MLFHLLRAVHPGWDPALVLHEGKGCPVPGGEGRRRVRHRSWGATEERLVHGYHIYMIHDSSIDILCNE